MNDRLEGFLPQRLSVKGTLFPAKKPFLKNIPPNFVFSVLGYILSTGNSGDSDSLIGGNYSLMEEDPKLGT